MNTARPPERVAAHTIAGPEVVLSCQGLVKKFGGITATSDVSLQLHRGARHALIGPNGAGKTTLINLLTGVLEPTAGSIRLLGQDITQLAPHERARRGMVRTFQINQLVRFYSRPWRPWPWWYPSTAEPAPAGGRPWGRIGPWPNDVPSCWSSFISRT
jgi:hypothetical protein